MISIVIPTNRPGRIAQAIAQARGQTRPVRIVLVVNGSARDASIPRGVHVVSCGASDPNVARNAGVEFVRCRLDGGMVAFMDDDDVYGPDHIANLEAAWRLGRIVGRHDHYVRTKDDRLLLLQHEHPGVKPYLLAPTVLFHTDDWAPVPPGPHCRSWEAWCDGRRAAGVEIVAVGPHHFAWWNGPWSHVFAREDSEWPIRAVRCFNLGPWDFDVVQGAKSAPSKERMFPTASAAFRMFSMFDRKTALQKG